MDSCRKNKNAFLNEIKSFFLQQQEIDIDSTLIQFSSIEEVSNVDSYSADDIYCENYLKTTTTRMSDGILTVSLPFSTDSFPFVDTRSLALHTFHLLERRFSKKNVYLFYSRLHYQRLLGKN